MKTLIVVPHSHTWFWTQTCLAALKRFPVDAQIVVVNNSPWSPAIKGITETSLGEGVTVVENGKANKFHASALDYVVENFDFDYLMAWETDVLALAPDWIDWFIDQMKPSDFAVGHWHHEQFVNPSCTLYRGSVLRDMLAWCREITEPVLRWGERFELESPLDNNIPRHMTDVLANMVSWICGPFAEKRGWPAGTVLKEQPSGQLKGGGWYEPGQQLHHWAVQAGYTYTVCPTWTWFVQDGLPMQTVYGVNDGTHKTMESADLLASGGKTAHLWGGTRALDILKHPVECNFVRSNTPMWLAREARFWRDIVPADVQAQTLAMIRQHGWHLKGAGTPDVTNRDREAAAFVRQCYMGGGIEW